MVPGNLYIYASLVIPLVFLLVVLLMLFLCSGSLLEVEICHGAGYDSKWHWEMDMVELRVQPL